jgi:hypothetical protein
MVKEEKGGLLHGLGHALGRGRVSTQLIFSHLRVQTWVIGLSRQKNEEGGPWQETKVWIVKQSQSQVCSAWPLSQSKCSRKGSGVVIWVYCQLTGGPSWGKFTVGVVSVPCHEDVTMKMSFLESKMIAKSLQREWFRAQTDTWQRYQAFLLLLVNLWAWVRCQCFLTKALWAPLTVLSVKMLTRKPG